jgi:hypothetical protein
MSAGCRFLSRLRRSGKKAVLGVVHLPPLPGSPGAAGRSASECLAAALSSALRDARALIEGGADGWIIENFGDAPFFPDAVPPETVAAMSAIAFAVRRELRLDAPDGPLLGINVLRNDASAALAIAAVCGLDCMRVNVHAGAMVADQGILQGRAHRTLRDRARLGTAVAILADVWVKHAAPLGIAPPDPASAARDAAYRGLADALIVTGEATGAAADVERLRAVRAAAPDRPILVGSGVTSANVGRYLDAADGFIVGTSLKEDGDVRRPVDPARVRELLRCVRGG